jgi:hypothetical protein
LEINSPVFVERQRPAFLLPFRLGAFAHFDFNQNPLFAKGFVQLLNNLMVRVPVFQLFVRNEESVGSSQHIQFLVVVPMDPVPCHPLQLLFQALLLFPFVISEQTNFTFSSLLWRRVFDSIWSGWKV